MLQTEIKNIMKNSVQSFFFRFFFFVLDPNMTVQLVLLAILLIKLTLLLDSGVLVLLVFRHKIVHVTLSLSELHFIHSLTRVPVKEGLAAEHRRELLSDTLEHLLDARIVS